MKSHVHPLHAASASNNNSESSNEAEEAASRGGVLRHWFTQNVYPLVTPKRIFYFFLSQMSFFLAYAFFTQTQLYQLYINNNDGNNDSDDDNNGNNVVSFFLVAAFGIHTACLMFLMFFSFGLVALGRRRYHHLLKSLGEFSVKLMVVFLLLGMGGEHYPVEGAQGRDAAPALAPTNQTEGKYSEVAGLATWCFMTIDAFGVVHLLQPGHHHTLLEATVTLRLHLGMATAQNHFRILSAAFVFVVIVVENYIWRQPQVPTDHVPRPVAWVPSHVV